MTADTLSLTGKIAIVTGSGRETGIGAGIAQALARNGAAVTINYVSPSSAQRAEGVADSIRSLGGKATIVQGDAATPEGANKIVEETLKAFNTDHIDILVNNAGGGTPGTSTTMTTSQEGLEKTFAINVYSTIYMTQSVVPKMPAGGRIINITSIASKMGLTQLPIYGAAKAAVDSLTYTWAAEFGRSRSITVNSIAPGAISTDANSHWTPDDPFRKYLLERARASDRIGMPKDVADAVLLLVSEYSRWITGQYISVSGGVTGQ